VVVGKHFVRYHSKGGPPGREDITSANEQRC